MIRIKTKPCADPEGGRGPDPYPLKNHKTIGFLSNTGPEKSQSYKASIQCWAIVSVIGVTLRAALDPLQFVDFMRGYRKFCQFDNVFFKLMRGGRIQIPL